jgi:hypothetical protein
MLNRNDIGDLPVVWTTGPGAVMDGFVAFMQDEVYRKVQEGQYFGMGNRTVTIMGNVTDQKSIVYRDIFENQNDKKHEVYTTMNMTHLTEMGVRDERNKMFESCMWHMFHNEKERNKFTWTPEW